MRPVVIALLSLLGCALASGAAATQAAPKARQLYQRVAPSLVVVQYTYDGELGRREINGAGIVVSDDGLVMAAGALTPAQIPDEQMKDFKILIPGDDETELEAIFQGRDERTGLMFVKAREERKWAALQFVDVPLNVGDPVLSVGLLPKDAGYKPYLMTTSVSALLRGPVPQVMVGGEGLATVGSPVFNAAGQAVGFVHNQRDQRPFLNELQAERSRGDGQMTPPPPRYFTPARDFLFSLSDPPAAGNPMKLPSIGAAQLSGLKKEVAEYFGLKGQPAVQIGDVIPGFPAEKAGLKSGDVIVRLNGQPLERGDEPDETPQILMRKLLRMKVGQAVTFSILRGKDQPLKDMTVTLEERPKPASKAKRFFAEDLGFTARELVFDDTYIRRLPRQTQGVVVSLVKPGSAAQTAKLQGGDLITKLNQSAVEDLDQFREIYQAARKERAGEAVVLEVLRGVNTQVIRIEPPQ